MAIFSSSLPPKLSDPPLVGSLVQFLRDPVALCDRGYAAHGPVFSFRLGRKTAVALLGPEHHRFFFQETGNILSRREAYRFIGSLFQEDIMFLAEPEEYEAQKAVFFPAFQGRRLHGYGRAMIREAEDWVGSLGEEGEIDVVPHFGRLAMFIATRAYLGDEFRANLGPRFWDLFEQLAAGIDFLLPMNLPLPRFRRRDRAKAELHALFSRILAERRSPEAPPQDEDFLQALMQARYADGRPFPDRLITNLVLSLVWAGHETTSGTTGWALVLLLQNPDYLAKVVAELDRVLPSLAPGAPLDAAALHQMKHMEWALRETERMRPVVPLILRVAARDFEIGGYRIPRGWYVLVCPQVAHRMPEVFEHPERYDPERFSPDRGEGTGQFDLIGFGGAHHRCAGMHFANHAMTVILATLLRRYTLELVTADPQPITRPGAVRGPSSPCLVRYRRR